MRVQLVDNFNRQLVKKNSGLYTLNAGLGRFTGLVTTGYIFAMRNGTSNLIKIHKMIIEAGFSGTGADSAQICHWRRFSAAALAGGTSILTNIVKNRSDMVDSTLVDARVADITGTTPLTVSGVTFETGEFREFVIPRRNGSSRSSIWNANDLLNDTIDLLSGEGIALHIDETAVVGDIISTSIEYGEYPLNPESIA